MNKTKINTNNTTPILQQHFNALVLVKNMIEFCKKTKKQQYYVEQYNRSKTHTLCEAYKKPSYMKEVAYDGCLAIEYENGGMYGKIISFNRYVFTYAFKYWREIDNGKAVKTILKVITPLQIFDIDLQIEYFNTEE